MKEIIIGFLTSQFSKLIELFAQDKREDRTYLKQKIRAAVEEARNGLAELRVNEFKMMHGNRWLTRMNALVEKLSLADPKLGSLVWNLFNAPTRIESIVRRQQYNLTAQNPESIVEITKLKREYLNDIEWAMKRLNELEKNPLSRKHEKK